MIQFAGRARQMRCSQILLKVVLKPLFGTTAVTSFYKPHTFELKLEKGVILIMSDNLNLVKRDFGTRT
jgi:hypothetical protein